MESSEMGIPSLSAINSILTDRNIFETRIAHTPILPYPATCYDSINTTLLNYQDVLLQRGQSCGSFWCDEGVYWIAKELQLLDSKFDNIFIGLGGFHMEKNILGCIGQYLQDIGVRDIFIQSRIFTPTATDNKIMNGGDYILSRSGMRFLCEAISRLRFDEYCKVADISTSVKDCALSLHSLLEKGADETAIKSHWRSFESCFTPFQAAFISEKSKKSDRFRYLSMFINTVMPVMKS